MKKIIVITSGKGGVGKTTTVINLAAAINHFGKDVLIVDGNLTTPNIGIYLNSPEVPVTLNHVLSGKAKLIESIYVHKSGFKVLPSSLSVKELNKIKTENLKLIKNELKNFSEYVLVDSSAGLGKETLNTLEIADEIIVVTNPELPAITDALKVIKVAEKMKKKILGAIVTRVRKDKIEMQPDNVKELLEIPILGMVPEDISVKKSLNSKDAVVHSHPKSYAARAYKEIAARLIGVYYDSDKDKERLVKRILQKMNLLD